MSCSSTVKVYAVDVGRDQLDKTLRGNPRVVALEATDARRLDASVIPQPGSGNCRRCELH